MPPLHQQPACLEPSRMGHISSSSQHPLARSRACWVQQAPRTRKAPTKRQTSASYTSVLMPSPRMLHTRRVAATT